MSDGRPAIDWAAIKRDYEAGTFPSVRLLAANYGCSHVIIGKIAKRENWSKGLAAVTAIAAQRALASAPAVAQMVAMTTLSPAAASEAVQTAVALRVEVVRQHRVSISRNIERLHGFSGFLDLAIEQNPPETQLQIDAYVETFERITRVQERLIKLERQAFGIADGPAGEDAGTANMLTAEQREALRAAVVARFSGGRATIEGDAEEVGNGR